MKRAKEECTHEFKRVTRPIQIDHNTERPMLKDGQIQLGGGEFTAKGAIIVFLQCKNCTFKKATDMEIKR